MLRVSGAQWLSRLGMGANQIQLLGRWSSAAVEGYIQLAPLLQVERMAGELLHPTSSGGRRIRGSSNNNKGSKGNQKGKSAGWWQQGQPQK